MQVAEVELLGVPTTTGRCHYGLVMWFKVPQQVQVGLQVRILVFVIDDDAYTKYLNFDGESMTTGFQVTPSAGVTVVQGLTLTTANDDARRDPITYELYGSNDSIDGPYELIAAGDVVDFNGEEEWPRNTMNASKIWFSNAMAYRHYQVLFPVLRDKWQWLLHAGRRCGTDRFLWLCQ